MPMPLHPELVQLVVIQPTSLCNINCRYCYVPNRQDGTVVDDVLLEKTLRCVLRSEQLARELRVLWHAGEPLTAGIQFFQRAMQLMALHKQSATKIINSIQTNATLITEEWCELFTRHSFSIGVSLDGPAFLHDQNRRDWGDKGTHARAMRGVALLKKHKIGLNAICVLSRESLRHPDEIFHFFVDAGFQTLGFNVEEVEGTNQASTLQSGGRGGLLDEVVDEYYRFMARIFDLSAAAGGRIKIREISNIADGIRSVLGGSYQVRFPDETIGLRNVVIAKDGTITTNSPELAGGVPGNPHAFAIGNVRDIDVIDELMEVAPYLELQSRIQAGVRACAAQCEYFALCGGGFCSNKFYENGTFESTETTTCRLHKKTLARVVIAGLQGLSRSQSLPTGGLS